jgi:transposase
MSRHSVSLKQRVVEHCGGGERSAEEAPSHLGLDHGAVRKWMAAHSAHGFAGLSKKFSHYDARFRLSVLQRMWKHALSRR